MAKAINDPALREQAIARYEELGSVRKVAKELGIHHSTVARWIEAGEDPKEIKDETDGATRVLEGPTATLEGLLSAARVDTDEWLVSRWSTGFHTVTLKKKAADGSHELVQAKNPKITAWLERKPTFFTPVVRPVSPQKAKPRPEKPEGLALILPDSQHGFRRKPEGLQPLHDEAACDLALQAAALLQPDEIVLLGDMLDLAPWSSYDQEPELRYTTQPALEALVRWISGLREACPSARITYLEGNHEHRITKKINSVFDEAATLKAPGTDQPLFSIPHLLSLGDMDVDYRGPYGADYWLWGVRFHHGAVVRAKGGQTVTAMLGNATHSQVVGHIHRREIASRTIVTSAGLQEVSAMSPGCLCWTDGRVPHKAGSTMDWQQGLGLLYRSGDRAEGMAVVPIQAVGQERVAYVHGRRLVGRT